MKPECSEWSVWKGPEIEGQTEIGVKTLFVRDNFSPMNSLEDRLILKEFDRVWFCEEFKDEVTIGYCFGLGKKLCMEVSLDKYPELSEEVKNNVQLYIKVPIDLKEDDHICVGQPYKDEAFAVGKGNKVKPEQYDVDIRIK